MTEAGQPTFGPVRAAQRAVDAINRAGPPAGPLSEEARVAAFRSVLRDHGEPEPVDVAAGEAPALEEVLAALHGVFTAPGADAAAAALNALLGRHARTPRLVRDPGTAWHVHVDPPDASWATWFAATSAHALALQLAARGAPSWGVCEAVGCERVYLQAGPGRPRRTCSPRCATRRRVAEHRARRA